MQKVFSDPLHPAVLNTECYSQLTELAKFLNFFLENCPNKLFVSLNNIFYFRDRDKNNRHSIGRFYHLHRAEKQFIRSRYVDEKWFGSKEIYTYFVNFTVSFPCSYAPLA